MFENGKLVQIVFKTKSFLTKDYVSKIKSIRANNLRYKIYLFIIGFKNKRFVNSLVDEIFIEEKTLPMNLFFNDEKTVTARFERESIPKYASRIYFVRWFERDSLSFRAKEPLVSQLLHSEQAPKGHIIICQNRATPPSTFLFY